MYIVLCQVWNVGCTMYCDCLTELHTLYTTLCTPYILHSTLYIVQIFTSQQKTHESSNQRKNHPHDAAQNPAQDQAETQAKGL